MTWNHWQAPDRDSPKTVEFTATVELGKELELLIRTAVAGKSGTREDEVREATGEELNRPRRWHKIYERMGLLYPGEDDSTHLSDLGRILVDAETTARTGMRQQLARAAVKVLRKYQLKNPVDEKTDSYPDDCDIHPYWAIWKAAVELDGKLHWDELNREIFRVMRHADLAHGIERIRLARQQSGYDPTKGGSPGAKLSARCYEQETAPPGRDPDGQIRDQKTTPWFRRAGFGGLLLQEPGREGGGYWSIPDDIIGILRDAVRKPPRYVPFVDRTSWFEYFGRVDPDELPELAVAESTEPDVSKLVRVLLQRHNVVLYGPPGTGKTSTALSVEREWQRENGATSVLKVTFHPSYGYEDFVQGYRPLKDKPGEFKLSKGALLLACDESEKLQAQKHPKKVLLIIDEINRGDVARIFGELITYIEADKRGVAFRLAQTPDVDLSIPKNLYFLATMNTADKSISLLDVALRRRFGFIEFPPDPTTFRRIPGWLDEIGGVSLGDLLLSLNERLVGEGIEDDRAIGHALLSVPTDSADAVGALRSRFRFDIHPLISEYCYMDRSRVRRILGDLVDERGRLTESSDAQFIASLKSLFRSLPVENATPPKTTAVDVRSVT